MADGLNIACLLTTFFYVVMPKFIQEGRLYWMRTPLYYNSKDSKYIFTEDQWRKERNKASFTRAKGLGELSTKAVEEALFGQYKQWEQLRPQSWPNFVALIENLMGKDVETRRDFLFNKVDFQNITFL